MGAGQPEVKGYYCALDDPEPSAWTTSTSAALTNVPDGTHCFYVQAEDEVGNRSAVGSCVVNIDTGGPDAPTISSSTHPDPGTWYLNPNPQFAWTASSDLHSGIDHYEVRLDEQPWENVGEVRDRSYANVPAGRHIFMVRAADRAGNVGTPGAFPFNVDIGRPEVIVTAPADGSVVRDASVLIRGTASDDTGLEKVIVRVNGGDWLRATGTANWCAWAPINPGVANLVEARARDTDGKWGPIVGITLNAVGNLRPVAMFASPADGATVCDACVLVQGTASDDVSLEKVIVRVNGGDWMRAKGTTNWSAEVDVNPGAANLVEARARDSAGRFGPTVAITLNAVANLRPVAMFSSPADGATVYDASVLVQGTASDDVSLEKVIVRVNGGPWMRANGTTDWSAWVNVSSGANSVEALARDVDGQWGTTVSMTLNGAGNLRPVVTFTSPPDGATVYDAVVLVQGTASDDTGLEKVIVRVNGGPWMRANGTTNWSFRPALKPGANLIETRARDIDGQWGPIVSLTLIGKPDLRPVAMITSPDDGLDTSDAQVTVTGTATDDGTVVKVIVRVNGGTWVRATGTTSWSETVNLAAGANLIEARAYDDARNWGPIASIKMHRSAGAGFAAVSGLTVQPTAIGAEVVFALSVSGYVTADIINIAGRPVRSLVTDRLMPSGVNELWWDGRSNEGLAVPSGTYLIRLVTHAATGEASHAITTLQIAR